MLDQIVCMQCRLARETYYVLVADHVLWLLQVLKREFCQDNIRDRAAAFKAGIPTAFPTLEQRL